MTLYELEQGLNALYKDLDNAKNMDEETACRVYNVDCKAEIVEVIQEEIDTYEAIIGKLPNGVNYERTADMPYLSW